MRHACPEKKDIKYNEHIIHLTKFHDSWDIFIDDDKIGITSRNSEQYVIKLAKDMIDTRYKNDFS